MNTFIHLTQKNTGQKADKNVNILVRELLLYGTILNAVLSILVVSNISKCLCFCVTWPNMYVSNCVLLCNTVLCLILCSMLVAISGPLLLLQIKNCSPIYYWVTYILIETTNKHMRRRLIINWWSHCWVVLIKPINYTVNHKKQQFLWLIMLSNFKQTKYCFSQKIIPQATP